MVTHGPDLPETALVSGLKDPYSLGNLSVWENGVGWPLYPQVSMKSLCQGLVVPIHQPNLLDRSK